MAVIFLVILHTNAHIHLFHRAHFTTLLRCKAAGAVDHDREAQARGVAHWLLGVQPGGLLLHAVVWLVARGHRHPCGPDAIILCLRLESRLQGRLAPHSITYQNSILLHSCDSIGGDCRECSAPCRPFYSQPRDTAVAHDLWHLRTNHLPLALRLSGGLFGQAPRVMPAACVLAHKRGGSIPHPRLRHHTPRPHPHARTEHLHPDFLTQPLRGLAIFEECVIAVIQVRHIPRV